MTQFLQSTCRTGRTAAAVVLQMPATADHNLPSPPRDTTSGDLHIMLAAYVLGALSDRDSRAFKGHLPSCAQCRTELDELAGITRLLDLLDPAILSKPA